MFSGWNGGKMERWQLDNYCLKILLVLIAKSSEKPKMRFNELSRVVKDLHLGISKPTLSDHLKHLVENEYVTRTVEGVQCVTYSLNFEKIGKIKGYWEKAEKVAAFLEKDRDTFFSLPENEQVTLLLHFMNVRKLLEIQARIAFELDRSSFEKQFGVLFWTSSRFERHELWMIQKCVKDEKYREEVLKTINQLLKPQLEQAKAMKGEFKW